MTLVLVIDDDPAIRDVLRQTFERAGFDVDLAVDGGEGMECYRRRRPDVVITDIVMPDREGVETMLEIKEFDPGAKIIAISGGGRAGAADFLAVATKFGAQRSFAKPLDRRSLMAAVRELAG